MAPTLGYNRYSTMLMQNNDFHNNTEYFTIVGHHPHYQDLELSIDGHTFKKNYKYLKKADGFIDVVETNDSMKDGKYFIIVDTTKWLQAETAIDSILKATILKLRNREDIKAQMRYNVYPSLQLGFSARGYLAQSAASFANMFNERSTTTSSL